MKTNRLCTLLTVLLLWMPLQAQQNDPYDQRGVQFAAQGTDFWVCFPRTRAAFSNNASRLYVASERDCDVTVECPLLNYRQTVHIMRREMCGPDTNYIDIPYAISHFLDTIEYTYPISYDCSYIGQAADLPQPKGFHVTSTDTVSLFLWVRAEGASAATNVLPTELLRDEYVVQIPRTFRESTIYPPPPFPWWYVYNSPSCSSIDIVAVEDNTVVDIILKDWDWVNRHPGDTITVAMQSGEMYHIGIGQVREKYYPLFEPYYSYYDHSDVSPTARPVKARRHAFDTSYITIDTFVIDLSGTRIKARDCKRIAVFEGGGSVYFPHSYVLTTDLLVEQSLPTKFAGKEFLVPNVDQSDTDYIRITGLHDSTLITIHDGSRSFNNIRTLTVDAYETEWFALMPGDGPFYVYTSEPVMMKEYLTPGMPCTQLGRMSGDPAFYAVKPVEWWHNGQVNYGTLTDVDADNNRQLRHSSLYLFTRNEDVGSILVDSYNIGSYFTPIIGTPYSHAHFPPGSQFVSEGSHYIKSTTGAKFMAVMASAGVEEGAVTNLPHVQPGKTYLTVNGIPSDSLSEDSIWCMYDPITFRSWDERPADSVFWDFGDGTTRTYSHLEEGFDSPQVHTYQDTGKYRVMCVFTYEYDSCFTLKPDTLWAPIWIHNHYDSSFSVHLCEGSYTFRNHLLEYTDTYYITTYWTPSGCDTLFTIDFSTCPHCSWDYDTVSPLDMPWQYNGYTFGSEVHDEPVHIPIGDDCDSVIYYTLIVIPHWGEPPLDSVFILAPNVITPNLPGNNRFSLYCSHHILQAEVTVFNRMGTKVAQFDGLTGSWDGTSQGRTCHQGAYVYYIRYIDTSDTNWKTLKGTVTLIY